MKRVRRNSLPVVVLGACGTGLYLADCIEHTKDFSFAGFLDDDERKQKEGYEGLPVIGSLNSWKTLGDRFYFISSLYSVKKMENYRSLVESLRIPDKQWATIIDPRATVCTSAKIGRGSFVGPGSVIEPAAVLGQNCALLGNVYLSHHSELKDFVVCANSVSIAGGVYIGEASYVGANATIHQYVRIDSLAVIGLGAVVLKSVTGGVTVVGNPAKPIELLSRVKE